MIQIAITSVTTNCPQHQLYHLLSAHFLQIASAINCAVLFVVLFPCQHAGIVASRLQATEMDLAILPEVDQLQLRYSQLTVSVQGQLATHHCSLVNNVRGKHYSLGNTVPLGAHYSLRGHIRDTISTIVNIVPGHIIHQ